uniref:Isopropylmalate/homocitrate/citramalate synthase n=1 Tax=Tolypothrix bouteillei VB521301 TaxID=1479485 RepID=A0A0C1R239_9CYAN
MTQEPEPSLENFLYQKSTYRGKFTPQRLVFNANLQEFATRVSYICGLQNLGKISSEEAHNRISILWQQLERSYLELGLGSETED